MDTLLFTEAAAEVVEQLAADPKRLKKVRKTLGLLETNTRHPGLNSHPYIGATGPGGEAVWESYVENHAPGAWRVWWFYGPDRGQITILEIGPHPD